MGPAAVPAMIEALGGDPWETDEALALVLGRILRSEAGAVP